MMSHPPEKSAQVRHDVAPFQTNSKEALSRKTTPLFIVSQSVHFLIDNAAEMEYTGKATEKPPLLQKEIALSLCSAIQTFSQKAG